MIVRITYKRSVGQEHHYDVVDTNFTTEAMVCPIGSNYVNDIYDEMAIIDTIYSSRQLPVAPNIALYLYTKYSAPYSSDCKREFDALLDAVCQRTHTYYPATDINKYKSCILRHFNKLLWSKKYNH
jgi:hypothetical protein